MNKLTICLVSLMVIVSCSQGKGNASTDNDGTVQISGKIKTPGDGLVLLQELQENQMATIDTLQLNSDNEFETSVKISEPGFFRLSLYDKQFVNFILDKKDVEILADGTAEGEAEVKGSVDTDHFNKINKIMEGFQQKVKGLEEEFQSASIDKDQPKIDSLQAVYLALDAQKTKRIKSEIREMDSSIAALYAVNFLDPEKDFPFFDSLSTSFQKNLPDSKYTQQFTERVNSLRALAVGQMAPDIVLPNPAGDTVRLSSLRGNYVLIDFWAAWCRPCRMENPNVVRMYNKYKDKGFEVFGVSLDKNKEDWVTAIQKDNLVWTQVSDLQYFNSSAARLYNIQAIPATFLIGPDGKIVGKNLRGPSLEQKLEEVL